MATNTTGLIAGALSMNVSAAAPTAPSPKSRRATGTDPHSHPGNAAPATPAVSTAAAAFFGNQRASRSGETNAAIRPLMTTPSTRNGTACRNTPQKTVPAVASRGLPATPSRIQVPATAHTTRTATSTSVEVTSTRRGAATVIVDIVPPEPAGSRRASTLAAVKRTHAWLAVLATVFAIAGCSRPADTAEPVVSGKAASDFGDALRKGVTTDAMVAHLQKLQDIANANNGTRAVGTPGFDASIDYVVGVLRAKGFDVQTPEFTTRIFQTGKTELTVGGAAVEARALEFSQGTSPEGVSGPLVAAPATETPGCAPADYDGLPVRGAVVLVDRGSCPSRQRWRSSPSWAPSR